MFARGRTMCGAQSVRGRTTHGVWEAQGACRAWEAEQRRHKANGVQELELNMEQKQQGRRRGRRAVSEEAQQQQRGLWEALLLPVAVTVLRALTL